MKRLFQLQPTRPDRAVHGYVYYRWTSAYIAVVRWVLERAWLPGPLRRFAGERLERTHHAKVVTPSDARRLIEIGEPIELTDLEHVVPFPIARDIVLDSPARIALAKCACRTVGERSGTRSETCGPLETCLYIGDPIASFVAEKQPGARLITAEEAVGVVEDAARRGDIHTLWFKDAAAGRMYAMCNCCSCCCTGLKSLEQGFSPLAASGYLARVDTDACTACGVCVRACAFGAVSLQPGTRAAAIEKERCLGCGVCVGACPSSAITLETAEEGPSAVPWSIESSAPTSQ